jgi:hypothetical protein
VEYYLSDENLKYDKFFHEKIAENIDGWLEPWRFTRTGPKGPFFLRRFYRPKVDIFSFFGDVLDQQ